MHPIPKSSSSSLSSSNLGIGVESRTRTRTISLFVFFVTLCVFLNPFVFADPAQKPNSQTGPSAFAKKAYAETLSRHKKDPRDATASTDFARACFDLAEFATNSAERADLAEQGMAACREVLAKDRDSAPAHYYLAMNLGQLARTKGLGALKLVSEMEKEFTAALELDEHFDHAGPDRNLGLLYRDAPAVGSVGSRSKARKHLQRAAELAPDYPENGLNLIETCLHWSDRNGALRALKSLETAWPDARAKFSGPNWTAAWKDWDLRLKSAKKKTEESSRAIESPRQKD